MQFNGVTNKEHLCSHSDQWTKIRVGTAFTVSIALHRSTSLSIPPPFPPSFHCQFSVAGATPTKDSEYFLK